MNLSKQIQQIHMCETEVPSGQQYRQQKCSENANYSAVDARQAPQRTGNHKAASKRGVQATSADLSTFLGVE